VRALLALVVILLGLLICASARAQPVSVAIVMAADVSGSIDFHRWKLQREGYAQAVTHPAFLRAVEATPTRSVAIAFVEWSGIAEQRLVVDWTVIRGREDAERVADRLRQNDRSFTGSTSIAGALIFAATLLDVCPFRFSRAVVDVSGDGVNADGSNVETARDALLTRDVTINGIVIFGPMSEPHLREHYEEHVVGGPGAFVMVADDEQTFAYALVRKLVREVAGR